MKQWNQDYMLEARAIAASIIEERGYRWKAAQIRRGRRPHCEEVEIAMRALMVARGEYGLKVPYL